MNTAINIDDEIDARHYMNTATLCDVSLTFRRSLATLSVKIGTAGLTDYPDFEVGVEICLNSKVVDLGIKPIVPYLGSDTYEHWEYRQHWNSVRVKGLFDLLQPDPIEGLLKLRLPDMRGLRHTKAKKEEHAQWLESFVSPIHLLKKLLEEA